MSGWTKAVAVLSTAIAVAACQDAGPEGVLSDYLDRVGRVTESDAALPDEELLPPYPPRRALTLEIPRRTINVVEFFELRGCDMGALVGFRNSPLGRLQSPSQRLGYETRWLSAVESCGADAVEWLPEMGQAKREWLPSLFWNATFAADEMRVAMGGSAPARAGGLAELLRGLGDSLTRVQQGGFQVGRLEELLGALRQSSWVGPARRDWRRWRRYLDTAAQMLREATPRLCLNRRPTPRTDRLKNVFLKFYVQRIQPELAVRMAEHQQWVAELTRLTDRLEPVVPDSYRRWSEAVLAPDRPSSEWQRTRESVVRHAEAWQALFAHCHVEPVSRLRQD